MSVTGDRLQPTLFELSHAGRATGQVPRSSPTAIDLVPIAQRRQGPLDLPELSEGELVRHYVNLSHLNHAVDTGFYPLGSCTMKYNPKVAEWASRLEPLASLHPLTPDEAAQGLLELLWRLEQSFLEITGMRAATLQPAAGAHGELTGILMVHAYHASRGDDARTEIVVPDSAHGTNPASAVMGGFRLVSVPSLADGGLDLDGFRAVLGPQTAAIMITYPSTLGLFETRIAELIDLAHAAGALAYMDGANLNAILGRVRPAEVGFDLMHINIHKTFGTPHGGGGPGGGPVAVTARLEPFLPYPRILRTAGDHYRLERANERPSSIGRVRSHVGNTGVLVRAYVYLLAHGGDGLKQVADDSVLAANYVKHRLADVFELPFDRHCSHEFVASGASLKAATGIRTMDVAKGLLDRGFHAPTVYFPLTVEEAMLIEPTETETVETLDAFAEALIDVVRTGREQPQLLREAPQSTPVRRPDEVAAARHPNVRWRGDPAATASDPGTTTR